jgi:hypothetical protein
MVSTFACTQKGVYISASWMSACCSKAAAALCSRKCPLYPKSGHWTEWLECPLRAYQQVQKDRLAAVSPKIRSSLRGLRRQHSKCRGPRHQYCKYGRNENKGRRISH